jgi:hypothetical protein
MKSPLIFFLAVIILGSCTEEIFLEGETVHDTVTIIKKDTVTITETDTLYIEKTFWKTDTVEIQSVTTEVDTFFVATIDSVFIYETDTIYIVEHHYHYYDTMYIFPGRSVYFVPEEYQDIVNQFFEDAIDYGWSPVGGNLLIAPWTQDEAPPVSRSSFSYHIWSQDIIKLKETIDPEFCFTPLYRELARLQLGKPYSTNPNDIMNPDFDWNRLTLHSEDRQEYLDVLFAH